MSRVWLIPWASDWTYAFNARAVARELADRYEIRIAYRRTPAADLRGWRADLAVDFWWGGAADRLLPGVPIIKQVSSHRWGRRRWGTFDAAGLARTFLRGAAGVIVPSERLRHELAAVGVDARIAPKGFDPTQFGDQGRRRGGLEVGWAGNGSAPDKNLAIVVAARPGLRVADACLTQGEVCDFYNDVDVITVASDAEGDPRPLIEGMACGCFPVTVDVGVVPELVIAGDAPIARAGGFTVYPRGIVVERAAEAFARAFEWCRANLEQVRAAGRGNAEEMLRTRTWKHCGEGWAAAFDAVLGTPRIDAAAQP